jgi:hypothetical protein
MSIKRELFLSRFSIQDAKTKFKQLNLVYHWCPVNKYYFGLKPNISMGSIAPGLSQG